MIRRETAETFAATAPIGASFRHFLSAGSDALRPIDEDPAANLVVLSNGNDVAAAFRRANGTGHVWQHMVEYLPTCTFGEAVETVRAMTTWMFEHYPVRGLCSVAKDADRKSHLFSQAIGGVPIHWSQGETVYEILGRVH